MTGMHTEHEVDDWTIDIAGHPPRTDSPVYVRSRRMMNLAARMATGFAYGPPPYQDHHGAGTWVKDSQGWLMVRGPAGIEWASQFCAEPGKVELLRQTAERIVAGFPLTEPAYVTDLGMTADDLAILHTPVTDAAGIAAYTDSLWNASVPLPPGFHTGVPMRQGVGGVHHVPAPVAEIQFFKRDDFQLWVTDQRDGHRAAVVPVAPSGSGDGRVQVLWCPRGSALHTEHLEHAAAGKPHILHQGHPLARQAFAGQAPADDEAA